MLSRYTVCPLLLLLVLGSCATRQPGDPLSPGYNVFSKQQDVELGRQAAGEIRQQVDVVDDPELQQYIRELGARLAQQPQALDYPYEFTLINEGSINAFALPGGPIFIHSGLVEAADNEGQLVGVLAHEISHVALRHGTSQASKAQMIQLPAILAGAVMGQQSVWSQAGQIGLGLGLNALIMKYSRSAEKQADALGAQIMAGAGFDPVDMANFFQKLEAQGGSRPPILLSSHPSPGNRVKLVRAEMETFPAGDYSYSTGKFRQAKQEVAQLPPPKPPVQQQTVEAAAGLAPTRGPSGFNAVSAGNFSVERPDGWEAFGGSGASVVTIAPRNGLVRTPQGGVELGYGVVMSEFRPRFSPNLRNATFELIDELQEMDPSMRMSAAPRAVTVSGAQGFVTQLVGRSPYGGAERDVVLTVARPQGVFYMVFVGPERGFDQLEPTFQRMLSSLRFR